MKKMKKLAIAFAIACCIAPGVHAQSDAFFNWTDDTRAGKDGTVDISSPTNGGIGLYSLNSTDAPPTTPLSGGLLLLTAAGLGYVAIKKRNANKKNDVL